jgi:3-oxoadipate enol-lactonase
MHSGLAAVGDTHLHWQESGAGDPLVFIHGFTLDSRMWAPQVRALCARYRVIVYDQRGFGRSDMPVVGVPYTHHDDLAGLLDHLGVPNAHIVGLSVGAVFALNLALVHPARVCSLTLLDTSGMDGFAFPPDIQQTFQDVGAAAKAGDLGAAKAVWMRGAWLEHARWWRITRAGIG